MRHRFLSFALAVAAALAATRATAYAQSEPSSLKGIRYWSSVDVTRVALETSADVDYTYKQLGAPARVFLDLVNVRPQPSFKGLNYTIPVDDGIVQRIRVAPNQANVTRVVLDLDQGSDVSVGKLVNPPRIIIDVRKGAPSAPLLPPAAATPITAPAISSAQPATPPPAAAAPAVAAKTQPEAAPTVAAATVPKKATTAPLAPAPAPPPPVVAAAATASAEHAPVASSAAAAEAAKLSSTSSLTRVLGLKLNRIVLDAGHGGVDPGSTSMHGLVEKELVLDVTLRLGRLLEEKMGAEVVYTRKDDTYIRLEERAPIANRTKADLFVSIHANSSPARSVFGTETYYLNRAASNEDLAVAARENATAESGIAELSELVKKIVLNDKRDESRELASRIQAASFDFTKEVHGRGYNRGVRHAPFVVLTGATMPSVLVEIGFMSNPKEETLLKRADHRQRLAESLYKGILGYARSLSKFSMARSALD